MLKYVALALPLAVALPAAPIPAAAGDWDWAVGTGSPDTRYRKRVDRSKRSNYKPRVMAYSKRDSGPEKPVRKNDEGYRCLDTVRGLGTQWIGTSGALEAAKKDWMERVRYDHGESYIDMTNARDFESRCGRTSIGEVAGQVTYRCEIQARPCKAPMKEQRADKQQ
jgi:hypothetical protein